MTWDTVIKYGENILDRGTVIAILALVVALGTWLFPRQIRKTEVPNFKGAIESDNVSDFTRFIIENEDRVIRIRAVVPMMEEEIWSESDDDDGNVYHGLTLKNKNDRDGEYAGLELSINPEKGSKSSPMLFANGGYHLNGFFVVRLFPGIHQGWISGSITELSADQLANRS